jgi:hypothetical protein
MTVTPQQKPSWQESARQLQAVRDRSVKQVDCAIADMPDTHTGRVIDVPRECLAQTERAITESPAEALVASLAAGKLTAAAVTNAFLRRAAIAQKLVCSRLDSAMQASCFLESNHCYVLDQLYLRASPRTCHRPRQRTRRLFRCAWKARWSAPWPAD